TPTEPTASAQPLAPEGQLHAAAPTRPPGPVSHQTRRSPTAESGPALRPTVHRLHRAQAPVRRVQRAPMLPATPPPARASAITPSPAPVGPPVSPDLAAPFVAPAPVQPSGPPAAPAASAPPKAP